MKTTDNSVAQRGRLRIARRLLPFLWGLYVIAFLDRVNVAYAALDMSHDLHFSDRVLGLGAGIFFIGYVVLEIPGAVIVERWSARRWIARIMISWGIIASLVGFIQTAHQFFIARFILGAAEAGFFPGIIVYLTHWFRYEDRAKAVAVFMTAVPISNIFGSPLAGLILRIHWLGLAGWRWLFILEGIPSVILGVVTLFYLTDWPSEASWLPKDECEWITRELGREQQRKNASGSHTIWQAFCHRDVILITVVYFLGITGIYGFVIWLPTILKRASGLSNTTVTLLVVLPYLAALGAMLLNAWLSDRAQERRWHTAVPLFASAAVLILALASGTHIWVELVFFILFAAFIEAHQPTLWALPTALLGESAGAAAIGMINCLGNLGGFAGPYIMGYLATRTGSFSYGLLWLAINLSLAGILVLMVRKPHPIGVLNTREGAA